MIQGILDAISIAIDEQFNTDEEPSYEIYTNGVNQGLTKPCFSIELVNTDVRKVVGNRYFRQHQFCVYYFPEAEDEVQEECFEVQEGLEDCLELITHTDDGGDGYIRGTNMNGRIVDNVLVFLVNYDFYVKKVEDLTYMEEISSDTEVEG